MHVNDLLVDDVAPESFPSMTCSISTTTDSSEETTSTTTMTTTTPTTTTHALGGKSFNHHDSANSARMLWNFNLEL